MSSNDHPSDLSLSIGENLTLTAFAASDRDRLVECLNDREIYQTTLSIPFPYALEHADNWLRLVDSQAAQSGVCTHFAIRRDGELIGGVGFERLKVGLSHFAEIGYWLAKPCWGQGITTKAVRAACDWGFGVLSLHKIIAHVFAGNVGSVRVLEKCGFQKEGFCRQHYRKGDLLIDAHLFARLVTDEVPREDGSPNAS